jgi:hypothetical protein
MIDLLVELRERVQAATGPDRMVDAAVALAFGQPQAFFAQFQYDADGYGGPRTYDVLDPHSVSGPDCYGDACWGAGGRNWTAPAYTASLDAALALAKAAGHILCEVDVHLDGAFPSAAFLRTWVDDGTGGVGRGPTHRGSGANAALAVLAALLAAQLAAARREPGQ